MFTIAKFMDEISRISTCERSNGMRVPCARSSSHRCVAKYFADPAPVPMARGNAISRWRQPSPFGARVRHPNPGGVRRIDQRGAAARVITLRGPLNAVLTCPRIQLASRRDEPFRGL